MKKILRFMIVWLVLCFGFTLYVNAATGDVSLIIVNPGADMSKEVNISWHTALDGTMVKYTLESDTAFTNKKFVIGECTAIPFDGKSNIKQCKATLTKLQPDTKYRFQVGKESWSEVYHFKTAGDGTFSFIHMTDIHAYTPLPSRVATANTILNKAKAITADLEFALFSGDVTAYGTYYDQWENLYRLDTAREMMYAITPGNHDYYNGSAKVTNISYFNAMTNNPANGAPNVGGSSYYFKYGDALFISIDSEAAYHDQNTFLTSQKMWFQQVVEQNPAEFIIVYCHKPFYTGDGLSGTQFKFMRNNFLSYFDQYGVDLVLTGDNHILARTHSLFNGQNTNNPAHGTVYIVGPQIGDRYKEPGTPPAEIAFTAGGKIDGGTVVTVGDGKIKLKTIDSAGIVLDSYEIIAKSTTIKQTEYLDSLSISLDDKDISKGTLSYKDQGRGRINKIRIINENNEEIASYNYPLTSKLEISGLPASGAVYGLKLETTFRTGEKAEKIINPEIPETYFGKIYNLRVEAIDEKETGLFWDSALIPDKLAKIQLYVNGILHKEVTPDERVIILDRISPYQLNFLELRAVDNEAKTVYTETIEYGHEAEEVTIAYEENIKTLYCGDKLLPSVTVTPDQPLELEFTSSDESVATVNQHGEITAVAAGTCEIMVNVVKRWNVYSVIEVTVKDVELSFVESMLALKVGAKTTPAYTVTPKRDLNLAFKSSDEKVATVNENGEITAVGPGTCIINIINSDRPNVKATIEVTVQAAKKGCFASVSTIFGFGGFGLMLFLLRKRRYGL
ncbi:MAG: metallophosphoesterase [Bacilli bacterium]|nr:metallophosphoesterase [Bacilli bacterium]